MSSLHNAHVLARANEWLKSRTVEEGDCLLWARSLNSAGHPTSRIDGKDGVLVRRWVYAQTKGRVLAKLSGAVVVPRCGEKRCVSPEHLMLRSRSDCTRDSWDGRNRDANYLGHLAGRVKSGLTKLDMEKARQIRADERPARQVAAELGVSSTIVLEIRRGRYWRESARGASVFSLGGIAA